MSIVLRVEVEPKEIGKEVKFFFDEVDSDCVLGYDTELFDKEVIIKLLSNAGFSVPYYED